MKFQVCLKYNFSLFPDGVAIWKTVEFDTDHLEIWAKHIELNHYYNGCFDFDEMAQLHEECDRLRQTIRDMRSEYEQRETKSLLSDSLIIQLEDHFENVAEFIHSKPINLQRKVVMSEKNISFLGLIPIESITGAPTYELFHMNSN